MPIVDPQMSVAPPATAVTPPTAASTVRTTLAHRTIVLTLLQPYPLLLADKGARGRARLPVQKVPSPKHGATPKHDDGPSPAR
ncbi:hypothetical protein GCM10012320_12210 [Sinomonas cellulolyticus]|nr:hypothetical protein GCM10012320_12210 [Sinomonas sp. KCTC 49339]